MVQVANPIYDQTRKDANHQILNIDETLYDDDEPMKQILMRLTAAASDSKLRHDMNVEDEYFSAIEHRDTEILVRDKMLAEQKTQLDEQKAQLDEQKTQLDEQKTQLDEQKMQLDEQKTQLKASIQLMRSQGIPLSLIASALGITEKTAEELSH